MPRRGSALLKQLGAKNRKWDSALGRNDTGGRLPKQKAQGTKKRPAVAGAQKATKKLPAAA